MFNIPRLLLGWLHALWLHVCCLCSGFLCRIRRKYVHGRGYRLLCECGSLFPYRLSIGHMRGPRGQRQLHPSSSRKLRWRRVFYNGCVCRGDLLCGCRPLCLHHVSCQLDVICWSGFVRVQCRVLDCRVGEHVGLRKLHCEHIFVQPV